MRDPLSVSWLLLPAAGVAWIAAAGGIGAVLGRRPEGDERHPAVTDDGWTLTLQRVPPSGPPRSEPPVILGHGLMMNAACWSLSEAGSLPRRLAELGFDVWVAEYRSTDGALPPDGDDTPGRWDYDVDDIARLDLPAIIDAVRGITGARTVSWVGHSMGGIVIHRYAAAHGSDALHRVVTLGTPVRFDHIGDVLPFGVVPRLRAVLSRLRSTNVHLAAKLGIPAVAIHPRPFMHFSGNFDNHTRREQLTLAFHALQDNAVGLPTWFIDRMQEGSGQATSALRAPLLVLGGVRDRLAPPDSVRPAFEEADAPVVGLKIYGEASDEPRFGHSDLISSVPAAEFVVPDIVAWLSGPEPALRGGELKRSRDSGAPRET